MGGIQSATMVDGKTAPPKFSWVREGEVAGCGLPQTNEELMGLVQLGVGLLITLTEAPIGPGLNNTGVVYKEDIFANKVLESLRILHVPTKDGEPPTVKQIQWLVQEMVTTVATGKAVVAHCYAGEGRTGTMIACYLVQTGMGAADAIRFLRSKRRRSIHTPEQEGAVMQYEECMRRERPRTMSPHVSPHASQPPMPGFPSGSPSFGQGHQGDQVQQMMAGSPGSPVSPGRGRFGSPPHLRFPSPPARQQGQPFPPSPTNASPTGHFPVTPISPRPVSPQARFGSPSQWPSGR